MLIQCDISRGASLNADGACVCENQNFQLFDDYCVECSGHNSILNDQGMLFHILAEANKNILSCLI